MTKQEIEHLQYILDSMETMARYNGGIHFSRWLALEKAIQELSALEKEPKTGHWSHDGSHWENRWTCSECEYKLFDERTRFCPNCGTKMEG